jgi:hypothetical protein
MSNRHGASCGARTLPAALHIANASFCRDGHAPRAVYSPSWREYIPFVYARLLADGCALNEEAHDLYQFGVASGLSLGFLRSYFPRVQMWGFDTFTGLPNTTDTVQLKEWYRGRYDLHDSNKLGTAEAQLYRLQARMAAGHARGAQMLKGLFSETLRPALAAERGMKPAMYVDVDCDFYDSTLEAMEWMYRSELIVPGTLIGFDDWWTIPCATPEGAAWQPSETGEWRAFAELARKYGVRLQCVGGACRMPPAGLARCDLFNNWGPLYRVQSVAGAAGGRRAGADDGFRMAPHEVAAFRASPACARMLTKHHVRTLPPK